MATKDITDRQVCEAFAESLGMDHQRFPYEILEQRTGQPFKVCYRAMERAYSHGLIDFGVSLRFGYLTEKGVELLAKP